MTSGKTSCFYILNVQSFKACTVYIYIFCKKKNMTITFLFWSVCFPFVFFQRTSDWHVSWTSSNASALSGFYSAGEALISSETFAALLARSEGSRSLGWMSTPSLAPPPPAGEPGPPLGAYRPCRHNHRTATIGSQKLALIYTEPWDGLRLSVHQSVRGSRLDRTQAGGPGPKLSTQTDRTQVSDWSAEASGGPLLLFDQLIDLLTLAAGRVSLNLISEFISGRRVCTEMM